jgi:hypothetical protein
LERVENRVDDGGATRSRLPCWLSRSDPSLFGRVNLPFRAGNAGAHRQRATADERPPVAALWLRPSSACRFAHDTGEGGISRYHREPGGDLIWEIGSGYFGCRTRAGEFDPALFRSVAQDPQVKLIELKGAKPGGGGVLPAAKVTPEIAAARGVAQNEDCRSPNAHRGFSTPAGLLEFIARLRERRTESPSASSSALVTRWSSRQSRRR